MSRWTHFRPSAGLRLPAAVIALLLIVTTGCAAQPTTPPKRIALLAPFEGQYREIGYDVLYAARLALREAGLNNIELLPTDDGGTPASALDRAEALAGDPQVFAAIAVGYAAVDGETLVAFGDIPVIVVGDWGAQPVGGETVILGRAVIEFPDDSYFYPSLRLLDGQEQPQDVTFASSAAPPDADFARRYAEGEEFAPAPTPLATLVYDAVRIAANAVSPAATRADAAASIANVVYDGINGRIQFIAHAWVGAPTRFYRVQNGVLTALENPIE